MRSITALMPRDQNSKEQSSSSTSSASRGRRSSRKKSISRAAADDDAVVARRVRFRRKGRRSDDGPKPTALSRRASVEGRRSGVRYKENVQKDAQGMDRVDDVFTGKDDDDEEDTESEDDYDEEEEEEEEEEEVEVEESVDVTVNVTVADGDMTNDDEGEGEDESGTESGGEMNSSFAANLSMDMDYGGGADMDDSYASEGAAVTPMAPASSSSSSSSSSAKSTSRSSSKKGFNVSFADDTKAGEEDEEDEDEDEEEEEEEEEAKQKASKKKKKRGFAGKRKRRQSAIAQQEVGKNLLFLDSLETGVRRSKRNRMKPLAYWKGETAAYRRDPASSNTIESLLPAVAGVVRLGAKTPVQKPRRAKKQKVGKRGKRRNGGDEESSSGSGGEKKKKKEKKIRLPKGFKETQWPVVTVNNEGEDGDEEETEVSVLYRSKDLKYQNLRAQTDRPKGEPEAQAAPVFNQREFIAGNVRLRPGAFKDEENTGESTQVFFVHRCQDKGLEVRIESQSCLLSEGDNIFVPKNTHYYLHNHSRSTEALLHYVVANR